METIFTQALGLAAPWRVVNVDFQQAAGRIVFTVESTAKRLTCPACGAAGQPIHDRLPRTNLQTARAWRLKQALRLVFACCSNIAQATMLLDGWVSWARRCRLAQFKRLATTLKKHRDGILEHFRSGLSNGFAEGLNGRIQAAKAFVRGYRSERHLITISYLICICAKLKHLPYNPWTHRAQQMPV